MLGSSPWYLLSTPHPVALIADKNLAEQVCREHCPHGSIERVDVSQCVVRPVIEVVNEHHPIVLARKA